MALRRCSAEVADRVRDRSGLQRVCLSGGTFQNVYLFDRLCQQLVRSGFEVFTHSEVPAGDGGLGLGQAIVAARAVDKRVPQVESREPHDRRKSRFLAGETRSA